MRLEETGTEKEMPKPPALLVSDISWDEEALVAACCLGAIEAVERLADVEIIER